MLSPDTGASGSFVDFARTMRNVDSMYGRFLFIRVRRVRRRIYGRWGKRAAAWRRRNVRIRYGDILSEESRSAAASRRRNVYSMYGRCSFIRRRSRRGLIYGRRGKRSGDSRRRNVRVWYGDIHPMESRSADIAYGCCSFIRARRRRRRIYGRWVKEPPRRGGAAFE